MTEFRLFVLHKQAVYFSTFCSVPFILAIFQTCCVFFYFRFYLSRLWHLIFFLDKIFTSFLPKCILGDHMSRIQVIEALTSHLMKKLERFVLSHPQFACQPCISENISPLQNSRSNVRRMLLKFSRVSYTTIFWTGVIKKKVS